MPDQDDQQPGASPWTEGMRRFNEIATQLASAAQTLVVHGAQATPHALAQPLALYSERLLAVSATMTEPLRHILEEQQRLVDMMAGWAEQHRVLSEQIAEWAELQRKLSEQTIRLAQPFLDQAALLESLHAAWSRETADDADSPKPDSSKSD